MISVNTNALIRILVDDPNETQQVLHARRVAQTAKRVYIPQTVQVECAWVLKTVYKFTKDQLVFTLKHLSQNQAFVLQNPESFKSALELYELANVEFFDSLILSDKPPMHIQKYKNELLQKRG